MKFPNVKSSINIDFDVENNDRDPKCKVGASVRRSKYKSSFPYLLCSKLVRGGLYY